jgi:hypothetical protein
MGLFALGAGIALAGAAAGKTTHKSAQASHAATHTASHPASAAVPGRSQIVVGRGWPIHRELPTVVVRPSHTPVRVAPATYLAPVVWHPLVVPRPAPDQLVWRDGDHLARTDDWTEMTFNTVSRGTRLFLEVESGRVQIQFAEIVFANGKTTVVDFQESTPEQGFYPVLDFKEAKDVDHVRLVARAKSDAARVLVHLQG